MLAVIASILKRMQEKQMKNRDQRTRLMSELLTNIKRCVLKIKHPQLFVDFGCSIKLYAWENAFIRKILTVRNDKELKMLRKIGVATVRAFSVTSVSLSDYVVVVEWSSLDWYPS